MVCAIFSLFGFIVLRLVLKIHNSNMQNKKLMEKNLEMAVKFNKLQQESAQSTPNIKPVSAPGIPPLQLSPSLEAV